MIIKDGVTMTGLQIEMRRVLKHANEIWKTKGHELVITSGLDGTHSAGSYHYYGYAVDLRNRYFTTLEKKEVVRKLKDALGTGYTVIGEHTHVHVQFNAEI